MPKPSYVLIENIETGHKKWVTKTQWGRIKRKLLKNRVWRRSY